MSITRYDKLVRDKIPEYLRKKELVVTTHVADNTEYAQKLREKLVEEAKEFEADPSVEELADVLEVLDALTHYYRFTKEQVTSVKQQKSARRGKFDDRIILESVTE